MAGLESLRSLADEAQKMFLTDPRDSALILDEDGDQMHMMLFGQEGERWRNLERKQKTRGYSKFRKDPNAPLTADQTDEEEFQRTFACMDSWHIYYHGEWIDTQLSQEKVREVFKKIPFSYTQAKDFIKNSMNFLPDAEQSYASTLGGSSGSTNPVEKTNPVQLKTGTGMNGSTTEPTQQE